MAAAVEREVLEEARGFLQERIKITPELLQHLQDAQILQGIDRTRIEAEVTHERKQNTFINILLHKRKDSFDSLLAALDKLGYGDVSQKLRHQRESTREKYDKLAQQLPHWLRGRYTECADRSTEIRELVDGVQSELFPGLSEACITSLLTEVLPRLFTNSGIDQDQRIILNVTSKDAPKQRDVGSTETGGGRDRAVEVYTDEATEAVMSTGDSMTPVCRPKLLGENNASMEYPSMRLDLRSVDERPVTSPQNLTALGPSRPIQQPDMGKWKTSEVCAWLATIEGIPGSVIEIFRQEGIRGRALMRMTKEEMKTDFTGMRLGDILEILEERDQYLQQRQPQQPQQNQQLQTTSHQSDPTLRLQDICLSTNSERSTKHPVQCASRGQASEASVTESMPSGTPHVARYTSDDRDTPLKTLMTCNTSDDRETPLKTPMTCTTSDDRETPLKAPMNDNTSHSTKTQLPRSYQQMPSGRELSTSSKDISTQESTAGKSHRTTERPIQSSQYRRFRDPVGGTTYTKGSNLEFNRSGTARIARKFVDVSSIKSKQEMIDFVRECVTFLCACLNDSCDGTIYFGVSSHNNKGNEEKAVTVNGVKMASEKWDTFKEDYMKALGRCFEPDQLGIINKCLHQLYRVPVASVQENQPLFILEVDVSPASILCSEEAFFVKLPSWQKDKVTYTQEGALFRWDDANIKPCEGEELCRYMAGKEAKTQERKKKDEQIQIAVSKEKELEEDLQQKLRDLLGKDDDMYPILVVNQPDESMTETNMKDRLSFLANVQFKATFDFDDSATISEYMENTERRKLKIVSTSDDFLKTSRANTDNPDRLKNLQDDIKQSDSQSWIFANGLRGDKKGPLEWDRKRKNGFTEAKNFFHQEIPQDRALIVFLLLSDDLDVMIKAAEGLLSSFRDQWICISESQEIAEKWSNELIRRHHIDKKTWVENSIVGVPLSKICKSVKQLLGPMQPQRESVTMVVTKTGKDIPLTEEYADLEVLSAEQYDNLESPPPASFGQKHEEEFYRGSPVNWWNFWYEHVLHRTKLGDLNKLIGKALAGKLNEEDQHVGRVRLYHQAGAGGTTLAMHALWERRKTYRCAVVNSISDAASTAEQILKLHWYGETDHPKPVLVLLDNLEDEKSNLLLAELEEQAKKKKVPTATLR